MRIALFTCDNARYDAIRAITEPGKQQYCLRHSYQYDHFDMSDCDSVQSRPYGFDLLMLKRLLPHYDWVVHLATDALITNRHRKIQDIIADYGAFGHSFLVSCDATRQINLVGYIANKTCIPFIDAILALKSKWNHVRCEHEEAANEIWRKHKEIVCIMPGYELNSIDFNNWFWWKYIFSVRINWLRRFNTLLRRDMYWNPTSWQDGDFIFHATSVPIKQKIKLLTLKQSKIWK